MRLENLSHDLLLHWWKEQHLLIADAFRQQDLDRDRPHGLLDLTMIPLHRDPWYTFRFAEDRRIPRFHLDGLDAGRQVSVFKINPRTGERLGLLTTATVGEGGWVDLGEPIIMRAGEAFIAVPERKADRA
jgi:hypothetical protein